MTSKLSKALRHRLVEGIINLPLPYKPSQRPNSFDKGVSIGWLLATRQIIRFIKQDYDPTK